MNLITLGLGLGTGLDLGPTPTNPINKIQNLILTLYANLIPRIKFVYLAFTGHEIITRNPKGLKSRSSQILQLTLAV